MSCFVAGTDTGVGKTAVAALLVASYGRQLPLAYWKPVATGAADERDTATVAALAPRAVAIWPETYLLRDPVSPHLAARREQVRIELGTILAAFAAARAAAPDRRVVVEGAGGLLVPLADDGPLLIDLIAALALPVLLVARSTLGTINHTLLSLAALRARSIGVAGVILNGPPDAENRAAIERFGGVSVLAEVERPALPFADAFAGLAAGFDRPGRIGAALGWGAERAA